MSDEAKPEEQRAKGERALKVFLDSQAKTTASNEKSAKASESLAKAIGDGQQGLVAVIADLIDELQDHREAMVFLAESLIAKGGAVNVDIGSILGGRKRARR